MDLHVLADADAESDASGAVVFFPGPGAAAERLGQGVGGRPQDLPTAGEGVSQSVDSENELDDNMKIFEDKDRAWLNWW